MDIKTTHKDEIKKYQEAVDKVVEKKKALISERWELEQQLLSGRVRSLNNDDDVFNMTSSVDPSISELRKKYDDLTKKCEYPISYDPEYREAYKQFLEAVQEDITVEYERLTADLEAAETEYKLQKAFLYEQIQQAYQRRVAFDREVGEFIMNLHTEADYKVTTGFDRKVDPLTTWILECNCASYIKQVLARIENMDQEVKLKHDPEYIAKMEEQEIIKRQLREQQMTEMRKSKNKEADPGSRRVGFIRRR